MTEPPTTTATPATEHRLEVLTRVLAMPGRPDLVDVEGGGQHVMIDTRELAVNVPISGTWQYADLAAQDVAAASAEESEAAARALLSALGIDATGDVASFEKNGPRVDVSLGACMFRFAAGPRLEWAICPIAAIP